jgi:hypothetical protein
VATSIILVISIVLKTGHCTHTNFSKQNIQEKASLKTNTKCTNISSYLTCVLSSILFFFKYDNLGASKSPWALICRKRNHKKCECAVQYIKESLKNNKYINGHGIPKRSMSVMRYTL